MLMDITLTIFSSIIGGLGLILPTWQVWPSEIIDGVYYISSKMAGLNAFFPIDTFITIIIFVINFEIAYFSAKIAGKLISLWKGTGTGMELK